MPFPSSTTRRTFGFPAKSVTESTNGSAFEPRMRIRHTSKMIWPAVELAGRCIALCFHPETSERIVPGIGWIERV
ncbi:hypothetical protein OUZ56_023001 [Daphnia magna]|uniref:Uncharacterized protein n=1 Tax=Daphnia magna TaxID=35525 RepID=A0ABR0AY69_9CRUS|nr:hypothetical protein OUZ56_023001 [Daphnia magna]